MGSVCTLSHEIFKREFIPHNFQTRCSTLKALKRVRERVNPNKRSHLSRILNLKNKSRKTNITKRKTKEGITNFDETLQRPLGKAGEKVPSRSKEQKISCASDLIILGGVFNVNGNFKAVPAHYWPSSGRRFKSGTFTKKTKLKTNPLKTEN